MITISTFRMPCNFQTPLLVPQASVSVCDVTSHLVASLVSDLCFAVSGLPFLSAPPACVQSNVRMFFVIRLLPCPSSQVDSSCSLLSCATVHTPHPLSPDPPTTFADFLFKMLCVPAWEMISRDMGHVLLLAVQKP